MALKAESHHVTLSKSENIQLPLKAQSNHPMASQQEEVSRASMGWGDGGRGGGTSSTTTDLVAQN